MPTSQASGTVLRWAELEPFWPRRLLRVDGDIFTSLPRMGKASYGIYEEPSYNILSYTWGRWETTQGPVLPVNGISWAVPPVNQDHFSVQNFSRVIRQAAGDSGFVWVDIACIDQENDEIKLDEIGNQAAIFSGAQQAYVWLSHTPRETFQPLLQFVDKFATGWDGRSDLLLPQIFSDPWFSSLWTLQEAYLRTDAMVLLEDGEIIFEAKRDIPFTLSAFVTSCINIDNDIFQAFDARRRAMDRDEIESKERLAQLFAENGIQPLNSHSAMLLYAVAHFRTTTRPLDRIYGIMQVYNLKLGQAAHPYQQFNLGELEDQFGSELNATSPVFAQLFSHDVQPRRTWCIQSQMSMPTRLQRILAPKAMCSIVFDTQTGVAIFKGQKTYFNRLSTFWRDIDVYVPWISGQAPEYILLDRTDRNVQNLPERLRDSHYGGPGEVNDLLSEEYGPELSVLLLGRARDIHRGRNGHCWVGIIVAPQHNSGLKSLVRIGICVWESRSKDLDQMQEGLFEPTTEFLD